LPIPRTGEPLAAAGDHAPAPHGDRVFAVAFSGGRDSLALLHLSCRLAAAHGLTVVALHVHHGLLPEADAWLASARRLCRRWAARGWPLRFMATRLSGTPDSGQSLEAWARDGRRAALDVMARAAGARLLLLAQHRRDQAETVLIQALRGAGAAGLAAMPARIDRAGLCWARPWLGQPREAIDAYVRHHRLRPVEDPSNQDPDLARSRLRLQVWPALHQAFPQVERVLGQVARRAAEADAALQELAALDAAACCDDQGLRLDDWLMLSPARRANLLRGWWQTHAGRRIADTLVQRLLAELPRLQVRRSSARWAQGAWRLDLYRGRLTLRPQAVTASTASPATGGCDRLEPEAAVVAADAATERPPGPMPGLLGLPPLACWPADGRLCWPMPQWGGELRLLPAAATQPGLDPQILPWLEARPRSGGERFVLRPGGMARSLKKQFQCLGVPAEARHGPLLWAADRLVYVPGLGLDARVAVTAGPARWSLHWCDGNPSADWSTG
jgi:tRNA(Ile)-lysidine synthase